MTPMSCRAIYAFKRLLSPARLDAIVQRIAAQQAAQGITLRL